MMDRIKISVAVPVYNMEQYVKECLDSILAQTLKEIEIICVDDGSTDGSMEILREYQIKHRNIQVISQKNQGSGFARNVALDIASGKYIAFMDADDYYPDEHALKRLYLCAEKAQVDICGGSLIQEKEGIRSIKDGYLKSRFLQTGMVKYKDYQYAYGYQRFIFQISFLRKNQIRFPTYRRFQDPPFLVNAMIHADLFFAITEDVYVYRSVDKTFLLERFEIINDFARGIDDVLIMSAAEHLEKLHGDMVQKFLSQINNFYKSIYRGNVQLMELLKMILFHIDDALLKEDGRLMRKPILKTEDEIKKYIDCIHEKERKLWRRIENYSSVVIYGAGMWGKYLYDYLIQKGYQKKLEFGISFSKGDEIVYGKKVNSIKEYLGEQHDILVCVAAAEESASVMMHYAYELGFENVEKINFGDIRLFQEWKTDI